jgi:hypothetical protein
VSASENLPDETETCGARCRQTETRIQRERTSGVAMFIARRCASLQGTKTKRRRELGATREGRRRAPAEKNGDQRRKHGSKGDRDQGEEAGGGAEHAAVGVLGVG